MDSRRVNWIENSNIAGLIGTFFVLPAKNRPRRSGYLMPNNPHHPTKITTIKLWCADGTSSSSTMSAVYWFASSSSKGIATILSSIKWTTIGRVELAINWFPPSPSLSLATGFFCVQKPASGKKSEHEGLLIQSTCGLTTYDQKNHRWYRAQHQSNLHQHQSPNLQQHLTRRTTWESNTIAAKQVNTIHSTEAC